MIEKNPIYLDADDDITTIIGKLAAADSKQVPLIIPKRSSVLQSVVNLKLIQKKAKDSAKQPILITEDPKILNLAASLEMLAAPNLKTEAAIPKPDTPLSAAVPSAVIEGKDEQTSGAVANADKPLAETSAVTPAAAAGAAKPKTQPKTKAKRVPNFDLFKKRFFWMGLGIAGFLFGLWAILIWLPKATIAIQAQTEQMRGQYTFTADTTAKNADNNNAVLPANRQELSKTYSKNFAATGKKDVGAKAKGTLSIKNCEDTNSHSLPAGTQFTSSGGKVFVTDAAATVPAGLFSGGGTICNSETVNVNVSAAENGDSYNIEPTSYSSPALSGNFVINGSKMTGGVTKIVSVVTQADLDNATKELLEAERNNAKAELAKEFEDDEFIMEGSLTEEVTQVNSDPALGQEASGSPRITIRVSYIQLAVKRNQLEDLIKHLARAQARELGKTELGVVDAGLDAAKFSIKEKPSSTATRMQYEGEVTLGPDINFDELKERTAGKKYSEAVDIAKSYPNVIGADVKFSPFWVRRVPSNPEKVTIEIKLPD